MVPGYDNIWNDWTRFIAVDTASQPRLVFRYGIVRYGGPGLAVRGNPSSVIRGLFARNNIVPYYRGCFWAENTPSVVPCLVAGYRIVRNFRIWIFITRDGASIIVCFVIGDCVVWYSWGRIIITIHSATIDPCPVGFDGITCYLRTGFIA